MSIQLGASLAQNILRPSDDRAVPITVLYKWGDCSINIQAVQYQDGVFWGSSRFMGCSSGSSQPVLFGQDCDDKASQWFVDIYDTGGQQAKKIIGTTRDSSGNPLGNCIVQGFQTSTDTFVGQVTSDTAGYFELPTSYSGNHYLVCYKAGSPDVAGTSANTLTPV